MLKAAGKEFHGNWVWMVASEVIFNIYLPDIQIGVQKEESAVLFLNKVTGNSNCSTTLTPILIPYNVAASKLWLNDIFSVLNYHKQ